MENPFKVYPDAEDIKHKQEVDSIYKRILEEADEYESLQSAAGVLKPYLKLREAQRKYGEAIVNRWIKEGLINPIKDGNRNASVRIDRMQIEAIAKTCNRANYLTTEERF